MLVPHLAQHPVRERQLAVRARPDAEVIAKTPVIEVVPRLPVRLAVGRGLVVPEAGLAGAGLDDVLHLVGDVLVRQRGRVLGEQRVRLQRQVVHRQVRGAIGQRRFEVAHAFLHGLARQRVHQVEVDVVETGLGDLDGRARLALAVDAAQRLEMPVAEALDADRQPVDAARAVAREPLGLEGAGVGFHRDLGVGIERQQRADVR
ncbi:hypothetical protein D3C86_1664500 [compost metagenome]